MITIVSPDLKRLAAGAKVFPKPLRASMRKQLAVIAREAANDAKREIRGMPVKGAVPYKEGTGLRGDIASAIRVSATANTSAGVGVAIRVAQTGALNAHNRYKVAKAFDNGAFRHPVYGNRDTWVGQAGYPYFKTIIERKAPEMLAAAEVVLREAVLATMPNVR